MCSTTILRCSLWLLFLCHVVILAAAEPGSKHNKSLSHKKTKGRGGVKGYGDSSFQYHREDSTTSSTKILFYSSWSEWSECDHRCVQTRKRLCQRPSKCGNIVLKEERPCHHKQRGRRRQCHKRRRHKHKREEVFNVVHMTTPPTEQDTTSTARRGRGLPPHMRFNSKLYGRWSRWTPCTRSCTTQRYRWCKRPTLCGTDVIREAAYCYVEGSFCQRWIQRHIQQQNDEDNEADGDLTGEETTSEQQEETSDAGDSGLGTECGVVQNYTSSGLAHSWPLMRIIGGRPATKGRWPWQVAVLNRFKEAFCGGTLVAPRWVLTAAHCIRKRLYVRIGEHDLGEPEGTEVELRVFSTIPHPDYDADTVDNDVALLKLPVAVRPDRYRGVACLPKSRQALPTNQLCTIIGWGKRRSSDAFGTDILHEAQVPIVNTEECRDVYEDYLITGNMFCAGYKRGRMDSCAGDSGGPLLCRENHRWTVFGITSFGEGCGKKGKYGIYTRLPNYVKWIQRVIRGDNSAPSQQYRTASANNHHYQNTALAAPQTYGRYGRRRSG
ncbi:uncharacterized protein [Anabrus simplex]|uniref:uncharacterized protein n=1 Tax=Anabrus simplex TaxID=316456 RepID=UPI0035A392D1